MNIKVRTNISSEFQDIEICINAPERNEIVQTLENELLSKSLKSIQQIVAMRREKDGRDGKIQWLLCWYGICIS